MAHLHGNQPMLKIVTLVATAAVISAAVTFIPLLSPAADAHPVAQSVPAITVTNNVAPAPVSDPAPAATAEPESCKQQTWPYIETNCLKGAASTSTQAVRTVSTVRLATR